MSKNKDKDKNMNNECNCADECACNENCECDDECDCSKECNCDNEKDDKIKKLEEALLRNQAELVNFKRRKEEETIFVMIE